MGATQDPVITHIFPFIILSCDLPYTINICNNMLQNIYLRKRPFIPNYIFLMFYIVVVGSVLW